MEILTEKYNPRKVDDIIYQDHIKKDFKEFIKNKIAPNMIIHGQAGTGKTSIVKALMNEISSPGNYLYVDCSVNNNVDYIKREIIDYMKQYGTMMDEMKYIILDESDKLSRVSQQTLRIPIEKYVKFCRVIFICNYIQKIIDPIKSRCGGAIYTAKKIPIKYIVNRLKEIAELENIGIPDNGIFEKVVKSQNGDMRKCVNILDAVRMGADIHSRIEEEYDKKFIGLCINGKFEELRDYIDENVSDGDQLRQIVKNSIDIIIDSEKLNDKQEFKSEIIKLLGECEYRLMMGSNHYSVAFWLSANAYLKKEELM
ncbi:MAG: AAA family ATPase [Candidatus Thorarchaeota archaeon]